MEIKDSGNRRVFPSGAVRDMSEGKGRFDLISLETWAEIIYSSLTEENKFIYDIIQLMDTYMKSCAYIDGVRDRRLIIQAFKAFSKEVFGDVFEGIQEVAIHYEQGAKKYEENNWRKGIPEYVYLDSAFRHLNKFARGDTDERHDRAFLWNLMCLDWTSQNFLDNDMVEEKSED